MDFLIEMTYAAIVFAAFRIFKIPVNKWTVTTSVVGGIFVVGTIFLLMAYCHPFTPYARIYFHTTPMAPQVHGKVLRVDAPSNTPLKAGDVLFTIDPAPFQAKVDELAARLGFAQKRLEESRKLARTRAGNIYDVERYTSDVSSLKAQLDKAMFDLENTKVLAPTDGYVTQVRLRPGMMTVPFPAMTVLTFVHDESPILVAAFKQNPLQNIVPGDSAEVIFPAIPGRAFQGKVASTLKAMAEGQLEPSGDLINITDDFPEGRVPVVIKIVEDMSGYHLPLGCSAEVAVYSEHLEPLALIRKVLLRMKSWENIVCFDGH